MKLIIPMAGLGKRMRPHTLATPKPLLLVAGKSIVQRIIENFAVSTGKTITEVHFVIGNFGSQVELNLTQIAKELGAEPFIHYQTEALGTAHAVFCAKDALKGEVCIAFADTLYYGNIVVNDEDEAIIWTYKVDNPSNYGVVVTDDEDIIQDFVEKPEKPVSDKAITGLYYFREGRVLYNDIQDLIDSKSMTSGEYQLTDNLKRLKGNGLVFKNKSINQWLDFGNKNEFLKSIKELLLEKDVSDAYIFEGSKIISPVYIGSNVKLVNSSIGPNVIIEDGAIIKDSIIEGSVIGNSANISKSSLKESIVGNYTKVQGVNGVFNLGDYNEIKA